MNKPFVLDMERFHRALSTSCSAYSAFEIQRFRIDGDVWKAKKYWTLYQAAWLNCGLNPDVIAPEIPAAIRATTLSSPEARQDSDFAYLADVTDRYFTVLNILAGQSPDAFQKDPFGVSIEARMAVEVMQSTPHAFSEELCFVVPAHKAQPPHEKKARKKKPETGDGGVSGGRRDQRPPHILKGGKNIFQGVQGARLETFLTTLAEGATR